MEYLKFKLSHWHLSNQKWCFLILCFRTCDKFWRCIFIHSQCLLWSTEKQIMFYLDISNDKIHNQKSNVFKINKLKHVNQYMYESYGNVVSSLQCLYKTLAHWTVWFIVWECERKICLLFLYPQFFLVVLFSSDFILLIPSYITISVCIPLNYCGIHMK